MGFSKKCQIEGGLESEGRKWVIAGIPTRSSLKPINTKSKVKDNDSSGSGDCDGGEEPCSTTPTAKEARIPEIFSCPPAPRKRRPVSRCNNFNGVAREFFTPPDLDSVFIRHVEKAN